MKDELAEIIRMPTTRDGNRRLPKRLYLLAAPSPPAVTLAAVKRQTLNRVLKRFSRPRVSLGGK